MIGKSFLQYQILQKLGEGGMGVVYKARDTRLDRLLALKILQSDKIADPERRRRFLQEARAASSLNHPNIVHIYDIGAVNGTDFMAMELVRGKTLDEIVTRRGLPLTQVLRYAIQIADALAKAHAAGIIHRDLKPSNIMVTEDAHVKVLDFGLAKIVERSGSSDVTATATLHDTADPKTAEGTILGTVAYMSPEQGEGKPVDARSDIFSFGSVLYEMVTGHRAFQGDTRVSTLAAILRDDVKPASQLVHDLPREIERIIVRCLRKQPDRRFQNMNDLKLALEELKDESDSNRLDIARVPAAPARRNLWRILLPLGFAALLLAIAGWWMTSAVSSDPALEVLPFTTYAGVEDSATFSPDGSQVAFSWDGEKQDNVDIYLKLVGPGTPVRLTTNPLPDLAPAWSPDGRFIAFLRYTHGPKKEVFLIPALGGAERKLTEAGCRRNSFLTLSWSADGKWLALPDSEGPDQPCSIYLFSLETGQRRKLTSPPPAFSLGDRTPALSPDGRGLAFSRSVLDTLGDLWFVRLSADLTPQGDPVQITHSRGWIPTSAFSPDGRDIIYSTGSWGDLSLWRVDVRGRGKPRRLSVGEHGFAPAVSARAHRLMYTRQLDDLNVWRIELTRAAGSSIPKASGATGLLSSTRMEHTPAYSPDGSNIAFSSNRNGNWEIWLSDADGRNASQLTFLGGPLSRSPDWSPDGQQIVFDARPEGQADIYIVNVRGGQPHRLTSSPASDVNPTWSQDGKWVYFISDRAGTYHVFRMSPGSLPENAVRVTKGSAVKIQEAPDGKHIYFSNGTGIWSAAGSKGDPNESETEVVPDATAQFAVCRNGIYFIRASKPGERSEPESGWSIAYFDFATRRVTPIWKLEKPYHMGFSVSSDERYMLYTQIDQSGSDLMLVEGFR